MSASRPGGPDGIDAAELARLGITVVTSTRYHIGPYRYGSLADALAQARRGRGAENDA